MIPADRDRVPRRQFPFAEGKDIGDEPERLAWRVDVGPARDIFLEDVVLDGAGERGQRDARAGVPRRRYSASRMMAVALIVIEIETRSSGMPSTSCRHVLDGVDGDAYPADLTGRQLVIRVVAHLRRQIECDAQAADPLAQKIPVTPIRFGGRPKARILPHGPQASAVHRRLDAPGVWEGAREPEVAGRIPSFERLRVGVVDGHAPYFWCDERFFRLLGSGVSAAFYQCLPSIHR